MYSTRAPMPLEDTEQLHPLLDFESIKYGERTFSEVVLIGRRRIPPRVVLPEGFDDDSDEQMFTCASKLKTIEEEDSSEDESKPQQELTRIELLERLAMSAVKTARVARRIAIKWRLRRAVRMLDQGTHVMFFDRNAVTHLITEIIRRINLRLKLRFKLRRMVAQDPKTEKFKEALATTNELVNRTLDRHKCSVSIVGNAVDALTYFRGINLTVLDRLGEDTHRAVLPMIALMGSLLEHRVIAANTIMSYFNMWFNRVVKDSNHREAIRSTVLWNMMHSFTMDLNPASPLMKFWSEEVCLPIAFALPIGFLLQCDLQNIHVPGWNSSSFAR